VEGGAGAEGPALRNVARPLIVRKLLAIADIEGASHVAHSSVDTEFEEQLAAASSGVPVVHVAREWRQAGLDGSEYARQRMLPISTRANAAQASMQNLLVRPPARRTSPDVDAQVDLAFENAVPVSINGVPLSPAELLESLTLIAWQHGVGGGDTVAPAALVLRTAYEALREPAGVVRLKLSRGEHSVVAAPSPAVNYA
jgi:argininosuccinate synthase